MEEDSDSDDNGDYIGISIDSNLSRPLDLLNHHPHDRYLAIEEAVVGIRESQVTDFRTTKYSIHKHRVIGLRLEGMEEMGFVAYKTERDGDYDDDSVDLVDVNGCRDDEDEDGEGGYMVGYEDVVIG